MLLTFNLKFIKSNIAGRCLVQFQIGGWPPDPNVWENRWWHIEGWQVVPSPSGSPPGLCQWVRGVPNKVAQGKPNPPQLLCSDSWLGKINSVCLLLAVIWMRVTHWASLSWGLAVLLPMMAEGVWWGWWAVVTFFAHQAKPIMHCPEVVDDCPLILAPFLHQGQWVMPLKWHSVSGSCMPISPITFGDSNGGTVLRNFRPFGKALST